MIKLKRASQEDAITIAQTRIQVWRETYTGIYPEELMNDYDPERYALHDRERIGQPDENYYLFLNEDECVGYFSFGPYHHGTYKDFALCLNHLYIRKHFRKKGLGGIAFSVVHKYCRQRGIEKFFCGCNANNLPAIAFYTHMGGIAGDSPRLDVPKTDQIIHFEFYLKD